MGDTKIPAVDLTPPGQDAKIYSLMDPTDPFTMYIGKTIKALKDRFKRHLNEVKKYDTLKSRWFKDLKQKGIEPIIELIDIVPEKEWSFWEVWYVNLFRSWGFNLKNTTDGGDGGIGIHHREEIIAKIKAKLSTMENPSKRPEVRKKISEALKGRVITEEWRKKMSENGKGKKMPDSMRKATSERMKKQKSWNKGLTKETDIRLKKKSEILKKRYASGEITHSMLGKKLSKERKEAISKHRKGKTTWSKKVKQINIITGEEKIFNSANDLNRYYYGKPGDRMASYCRNGKIYKKSFKFEYIK